MVSTVAACTLRESSLRNIMRYSRMKHGERWVTATVFSCITEFVPVFESYSYKKGMGPRLSLHILLERKCRK